MEESEENDYEQISDSKLEIKENQVAATNGNAVHEGDDTVPDRYRDKISYIKNI